MRRPARSEAERAHEENVLLAQAQRVRNAHDKEAKVCLCRDAIRRGAPRPRSTPSGADVPGVAANCLTFNSKSTRSIILVEVISHGPAIPLKQLRMCNVVVPTLKSLL